MTTLQKAQQKYNEAKRNYYAFKDQYEDHYYGEKKLSAKDIKFVDFRMKQEFDTMQTLLYIFGEEIRKD